MAYTQVVEMLGENLASSLELLKKWLDWFDDFKPLLNAFHQIRKRELVGLTEGKYEIMPKNPHREKRNLYDLGYVTTITVPAMAALNVSDLFSGKTEIKVGCSDLFKEKFLILTKSTISCGEHGMDVFMPRTSMPIAYVLGELRQYGAPDAGPYLASMVSRIMLWKSGSDRHGLATGYLSKDFEGRVRRNFERVSVMSGRLAYISTRLEGDRWYFDYHDMDIDWHLDNDYFAVAALE